MDQQLVMFYLVYGFLYVFSLLPLRVLYIFSDLVYLLLYRVFGYRRGVVRSNLNYAFPEKTVEEKKKIEKQFYKNFIDNFIETLKIISGGEKFARNHMGIDPALFEEQFHKGNKLQFQLGHNFNWELANVGVTTRISYPPLIVYMPIQSKVFDKVMLKLRSASGNTLLPATDMRNAMYPYRNEQYLLVLVADQVPGDVSKAYWLNFFGRPTPFIRGPERGAMAGNIAVAFGYISKFKRGQYYLDYELCTEKAASMEKGELTRKYARYMERVIRKNPEMWLWSHRRWKREWKPEYRDLWIDEKDPVPS